MLSYDCINGGNESLSILKKIESSEFIFCLYLVSSSYLKEMSNAFISTWIMCAVQNWKISEGYLLMWTWPMQWYAKLWIFVKVFLYSIFCDQVHNQPVDERENKSENMRIKPNQRTGRQASKHSSSKVCGSIFIYPINRDHFYQTVEPSKEQRKEISTKSVVSSVKRALTLLLHCVFISNLSHGKDKKSSVVNWCLHFPCASNSNAKAINIIVSFCFVIW